MLVVFGPSGSPRSRDHLGLRHQDALDTRPDLVGLRQRCSRQRIGLHGEAAFVKVRKERRAGPSQGEHRYGEQENCSRDNWNRMIQHRRQQPRERALEHAGEPAVMTTLDRRGVGQEGEAQCRRDDNRHHQRRKQRDDVGKRQWRQEPSFDTHKTEDRQEHQHDDDSGEDDRGSDLERRFTHDN